MTNDALVALEERGERRAIVLGGAAAPVTRDEAFELVLSASAAAEGEPARLDDVEQSIHERQERELVEAGLQVGVQLETELLEFADPLLLTKSFVHRA